MIVPETAALLRIYTQERARSGHKPLYETIVLKARDAGLAGATVLRGPMGFGHSHRIQSAKILDLSDNLPLVIEIVDAEGALRSFVASLGDLTDVALVTLEKVQILHDGAAGKGAGRAP